MMPKIYLASPLGFSPEQKPYLERIKARLLQLGYEVFNPWSLHFGEVLHEASQIKDHYERVAAYDRIANDIGAANENGIRGCDMLLAVLDGTEVDSGGIGNIAAISRNRFPFYFRTWRFVSFSVILTSFGGFTDR